MQTPSQAARRRDDAGARLPMPWASAAAKGVFLRRGQLAMLVAAPGVGKTVISTAYEVQSGVRSLHLSADTDAHTTAVRLIQAQTGCTLDEAELGKAEAAAWAMDALAGIEHLFFAFPSSPTEREIVGRLHAYREAQGEYPELLTIDNLGNVAFDDEEFAGQRRVMRELQAVALKTQTAILVLHHATGEHDDGNKPVPMSGISAKLSKFPGLILTAHRSAYHEITISVVKNRFGEASPTGGVGFTLRAQTDRMQVTDEPRPINWTPVSALAGT